MNDHAPTWRVELHQYPGEFEARLNELWLAGYSLIEWQFHPESKPEGTCMVLAVYCRALQQRGKL